MPNNELPANSKPNNERGSREGDKFRRIIIRRLIIEALKGALSKEFGKRIGNLQRVPDFKEREDLKERVEELKKLMGSLVASDRGGLTVLLRDSAEIGEELRIEAETYINDMLEIFNKRLSSDKEPLEFDRKILDNLAELFLFLNKLNNLTTGREGFKIDPSNKLNPEDFKLDPKDFEEPRKNRKEAEEQLSIELGNLASAVGTEDGLTQSFRDLDAALKDGGLLGALAKLAEAVEIAAARIAAAVNAPAPTGGGGGMASGGTVTAGQPVLVGERGPEIFIPGSAGHIVNAFDAAAGEGTSMGAGGGPGASGQTAVEREIIATLKELDATLADLDESIRQAEDAGILGSSTRGRSSSSGRFGTRGSAKDPLAQIDEALRLVESTGSAFENIGRVMEDFKRKSEQGFEDIAAAGERAFQSILGSIQTIVGNIFGGKAGRTVGTIGRIIGTGLKLAKLFGSAGGGALQPGVPMLVGERGPEVIIPRVPLTVKNNADSSNIFGGGGRPIVVNQTVNMTPDVKNTIRAEVLNAMPIASRLATQAVMSQLQGVRF